jgi:hypothetical protein
MDLQGNLEGGVDWIHVSCCSSWRWRENMSLNCFHQWAHCSSSPGDIRVCRITVEWCWQGKTEELRETLVPLPFCPPQIPHGLTQVCTWSYMVRGRRLTTWSMARPFHVTYSSDWLLWKW